MRFSLLALLLALAACDSVSPVAPPGDVRVDGVTFRVGSTEVRSGDTVELSLQNDTDQTVETGVFGCDVVERLDGGVWVQREDDNDRACILPLIYVEPGTSFDGAFVLDVAPGTVRLVHAFAIQGGRAHELASVPIRVVR